MVQPNAANLDYSVESQEDEFKFSDRMSKLAFMGSLTAYEGIDTVIEAIAILKSRHRIVTLDIFGDGKYRKKLEKLTKNLRLSEQVTFHGRVSRQLVQKRICDFDIYPIIRKNSELTRLIPPLKHLEPMLLERVVLVSDLPALVENVPELLAKHALALIIPWLWQTKLKS